MLVSSRQTQRGTWHNLLCHYLTGAFRGKAYPRQKVIYQGHTQGLGNTKVQNLSLLCGFRACQHETKLSLFLFPLCLLCFSLSGSFSLSLCFLLPLSHFLPSVCPQH